MVKQIPPLGALRAFEAASRHLSFARAAEELSVTPAAISHQIKQLEHWLGMKWCERAARGVSLTRAGHDYAQRVRDIFDRLISTSAAARAHRGRKIVHIRAQFTIAAVWLLPRVLTFNLANPDIEIQLSALNFDRNPSKGGTDIVIYHQRPEMEGYTQHVLIRGHYKAYAAPSLLARYEKTTPAALVAQPLLHTSSTNAMWHIPTWHDWFAQAGISAPASLPGMHFNLEYITTAACVQGAGYALLLDTLTLDSARAGSLVAVAGPSIANPHPYTLMRKDVVKEEVLVASAWLLEAARS
jgi:LysR family transcriptional regulator, glycine cleavage system transcriptional activator